MRAMIITFLLGISFILSTSTMGIRSCDRLYYKQEKPITHEHIQYGVYYCFKHYEAYFDPIANINIYSAELLTRPLLEQGDTNMDDEIYKFDQDDDIIKLYNHFPYEKNLMVPYLDMPDHQSRQETYTSLNIVPSFNNLYNNSWNIIENHIRKLSYQYNQVYVVSGAIYKNSTRTFSLHTKVVVPTAIYKSVYIPAIDAGGVYVCTNNIDYLCKIISLKTFSEKSRIDPFPALSKEVAEKVDVQLLLYK